MLAGEASRKSQQNTEKEEFIEEQNKGQMHFSD
jgi:hypothetical protein